MKAKETVINHEIMLAEIWDLGAELEGAEGRPPTQKERFERIAKAQAEISFKAGLEEAEKQISKWARTHTVVPAQVALNERQAGIKEVVKFIKSYAQNNILEDENGEPLPYYCFDDIVLQAKLKEWEE